MSKKLYILVSDGGDGSYYPRYTLDSEFIAKLEAAHESGAMDYENGFADGDGFHYSTVNVTDECTAQSLGIRDISIGFVFPNSEDLEEDEE